MATQIVDGAVNGLLHFGIGHTAPAPACLALQPVERSLGEMSPQGFRGEFIDRLALIGSLRSEFRQ